MTEEPQHRTEYREKCRHRGYYERCMKLSGGDNGFHVSIACTPQTRCPRMKLYDKRFKN